MSDTGKTYPPGEFAIVELLGHTTLVGRITEVEKFGTKMLAIEVCYRGALLPVVYQSGASIYRLTPVPTAVAFREQVTDPWRLPSTILAGLTPEQTADEGEGEELFDAAHDDAAVAEEVEPTPIAAEPLPAAESPLLPVGAKGKLRDGKFTLAQFSVSDPPGTEVTILEHLGPVFSVSYRVHGTRYWFINADQVEPLPTAEPEAPPKTEPSSVTPRDEEEIEF
jgi:hypothetical protein